MSERCSSLLSRFSTPPRSTNRPQITPRVTSSIMVMKNVCVLPKHDSLSALLERFNEFVVQNIVPIRQNMDQEESTLSPSVPVGETVSCMTVPGLYIFTPATMQEVEKLIKRKSCGLDPCTVPIWLLKQHAECLVPNNFLLLPALWTCLWQLECFEISLRWLTFAL